MTEFLFRADSYRKTSPASVVAITPDGVILDRTIFYANSGGQPGDSGYLESEDGQEIVIANAMHPGGDKTEIVHVAADAQPEIGVGELVTAAIDWQRRYRLMRMHTALHLLSVALPFPVTGGSIGEDKGRLDFSMPEAPADLAGLEARLNAMVASDYPVTEEWITDAEMAAQPELIKTMKVKPPSGLGRVRLIRIGDIDLQPCGGIHVAKTGEIGQLKLGKIESKGAQNRRVSLLFAG